MGAYGGAGFEKKPNLKPKQKSRVTGLGGRGWATQQLWSSHGWWKVRRLKDSGTDDDDKGRTIKTKNKKIMKK
jgi:hypothetical protein